MGQTKQVLVIESMSYSGTTWLNAILGCHEQCLAIGPPDRAVNVCRDHNNEQNVCIIHGKQCNFWPDFFNSFDVKSNFFSQLADYSGKNIIIINNPIPDNAGRELAKSKLRIKTIRFIRDGRALLASYLRKFPDQSALDAIASFLYPSFHNYCVNENKMDDLLIKYEDAIANPEKLLMNVGAFIGIDYSVNALKFWEYPLHFVAGNQGTIAQIKMGQDIDVNDFADRAFYENQFTTIKNNEQANFCDDRWKSELSRRELFIFDLLCGHENKIAGYERDYFSLDEIAEYIEEFRIAINANTVPDHILQLLNQRLEFLLGWNNSKLKASNQRLFNNENRGLRSQLNIYNIKKNGISLTPEQLKKLAPYFFGGLGLAFIVIIMFTLIILLIFTN